MRAELLSPGSEGKGFSSGGSASETRNVLFIEPGEKSGRWLLPDNDHVISEITDITDEKNSSTERVIATAAVIKSADSSEDTVGRLVLYNSSGKTLVEVANKVREVHLASYSDDELTILYERNRRFVLAGFDPGSLARRKELEIEVPLLK